METQTSTYAQIAKSILPNVTDRNPMLSFVSKMMNKLIGERCHGEGSMVRLSHGPAKYSEETVDSKLKREERGEEALPLRL